MKRLSDQRQIELLLLLVLFTGLLLRFWRFFDIPFTFDELSAMSRTVYDNFRDLIRYGVVENDTHPAGVQVFMYYWVKLFGEAEPVVKLPFILAGLASVYLAYCIGKLWYGPTAGILTAAYMSSLQLFVMYSQIARPYASGLFLSLMMVLFWSRYFFAGGKIKDLAGFVLFAALSSYNHHFSLLFAAIVGLSGLWLVDKKTIRPYILSGVAIFVLYLPHLPIFFSQLHKKGIGGWLAKPSPWFLTDFLQWLFHYSFWVISLLVFVVMFLAVIRDKQEEQPADIQKKRILSVVWFLLPVLIGYTYSVMVEPIIQYSLLIFTTPFLFLFLFSFANRTGLRFLPFFVPLILIINILTLVIDRQYYKVFYKQPFETMVKDALALDKKDPGNIKIINNYVPYYTEYYFRKYKKELPYYTVRNKNLTITDFKNALSGIRQQNVITCGLGEQYFQLVKEQFPHWFGFNRGFTFEEYVLSKKKKTGELKRKLLAEPDFGQQNKLWNYKNKNVLFDTVSNSYIYKVSSASKYNVGFERPLGDLVKDIYVFIDMEAEIKTDSPETDAAIVAEIREGKKAVRWLAANVRDFKPTPGEWQKVYLTMDVQVALKDKNKIGPDHLFRFFIWNKNGCRFYVRNVKIYQRTGNPYRYVLFTKIPEVGEGWSN
jgi:uncharacterized membrane protein YuzA (DUF378 family)